MELSIHHIGYLVRKINKGMAAFINIGYEPISDIIYDEYRKIDILFLKKDGYCIELVEPKEKESVVYNLLKKMGNAPYHICYTCHNLSETCEKLISEGYIICDEAHSAVAFDERRVCFLIHPFLGMIELLEEEKH